MEARNASFQPFLQIERPNGSHGSFLTGSLHIARFLCHRFSTYRLVPTFQIKKNQKNTGIWRLLPWVCFGPRDTHKRSESDVPFVWVAVTDLKSSKRREEHVSQLIQKAREAQLKLSVSRFSINQIGSNSLGGTLANGLNPTATLGCGTWSNNSLSENLWFHHLVNISRIAYEIKDAPKLTDEEIWSLT
ncbi:MAG: hypothetical protein LBS00_03580 [Synergistaceae bacterium]|nr:hypothetical protein [Synergistaceae bacterium]